MSGGGSRRGGGGEGDIHAAARSGDLTALQLLLGSNPLAVNTRDKHSRTPLHLAAWAGHAQVVSYLCKHKADVGAAAMDDMGAIHFAAQKGHLEAVRSLVQSGASIKAFTRKGLTPLHYAVQGSHLELVKYLIKKGADLNVKTKAGRTPLDIAEKEDIRLFLEESERSSKTENTNPKMKAGGQSDSEPLAEKDKPDESNPEAAAAAASEQDEEGQEEGVKRKVEPEGDKGEAAVHPVTKRPRVALNHLLTADDTEEEET
ncbi:unnamed protein product [Linum tenue]|uniref:Uncharacterized protein n=1 Tax=Linum tenue TaxID=586396 RepID=A0AAV0NS59_9ROSI|nr:unnamed protein product [Linum tenue]